MLGKLLKHEMKAMGRIMLPLYMVMIFAACLFAFNLRMNMNGMARFIAQRFAIVTGILFGAAVLVVGVVMIVMVIQRFYKNLLGTEGYLMFTLPAKTHELILSKALSAFLWMLIGGLCGMAAGFAMIAITSSVPEFLRQVREIWKEISPTYAVSPVIWLIVFLIVGMMESLIKVYAAISVGHQFGSHRIAGSVLAYFGFGMIELALSLAADKLHLRPADLLQAAGGAGVPGVRALQLGTLTALAGIAIYGLVSWYLLDHRLNLE